MSKDEKLRGASTDFLFFNYEDIENRLLAHITAIATDPKTSYIQKCIKLKTEYPELTEKFIRSLIAAANAEKQQ